MTPSTKNRIRRILKWFLFSVLIALAPLAADGLNRLSQISGTISLKPITVGILGHGELLLISAALAADTIGDLIASGEQFKTLKLVTGGASAIIILLASIWYADIAGILLGGRALDFTTVAYGSSIILAATVLASGCGKFVAED